MSDRIINWRHLWEAIPIMLWVWLVRVATTFIVVFGTLASGLARDPLEALSWLAIVIGTLMWTVLILEKVE